MKYRVALIFTVEIEADDADDALTNAEAMMQRGELTYEHEVEHICRTCGDPIWMKDRAETTERCLNGHENKMENRR